MSKKMLCLMSLILVMGAVGAAKAADTIFFQEFFEDDNFTARGWYDGTFLRSTTEHIPGSTSSAEFHFTPGATSPGYGGRIQIPASEKVYVSFYIKHSTSWTGSNQPYHPHQFHFTTNMDSVWVGPAYTYSTL